MQRFHSTVSRRQFMKGMGLAGFGLGAAALTTPVFHDMDELASSASQTKDHWWIKEREFEDITTPIDWTVFNNYDSTVNPRYKMSTDTRAALDARNLKIQTDGINAKTPGNALRDYAICAAVDGIGPDPPWNGNPASDPDYPMTGWGQWQDTPENNLAMVRAAAHFAGCPKVGALPVNEHTKRLFDKNKLVWEDISGDAFQDSKGVYHIPNRCQSILVFETGENHEGNTYVMRKDSSSPSGYGSNGKLGMMYVGIAYSHNSLSHRMYKQFIRNIGYQALKPTATANVPFGILAGLSEQGRPAYRMSPEFGLTTRYANFAITDLPVSPTKPIDFGGNRFCKTCKTCGKSCPVGAIDMADDTSYETAGTFNRPGFKGFWMNYGPCIDFGSPGDCGICQAACPFDHPANSLIHPLIRATAGTTGVFNSFFATMERNFYGAAKTPDDYAGWWNRDLSTWTADTVFGGGKGIQT